MSSRNTVDATQPAGPDRASLPSTSSAGTDHALEALLAVRAQVVSELPEDLLRECYAIQKQFQFDRDEQLPIVRTRRLVESFVEREPSVATEGLVEAGE